MKSGERFEERPRHREAVRRDAVCGAATIPSNAASTEATSSTPSPARRPSYQRAASASSSSASGEARSRVTRDRGASGSGLGPRTSPSRSHRGSWRRASRGARRPPRQDESSTWRDLGGPMVEGVPTTRVPALFAPELRTSFRVVAIAEVAPRSSCIARRSFKWKAASEVRWIEPPLRIRAARHPDPHGSRSAREAQNPSPAR